ncbi:MAG: D-aminoacyl-tRNA deacylase [bacterium]|nr:D-aminoacyl-tRNA deacylase [bacterium]
MKIVAQRVDSAHVEVDGKITGEINKGLLGYLGIGKNDTEKDPDFLVNKVANLRIFEDNRGKMNLSVKDVSGAILVVSQFTLFHPLRQVRTSIHFLSWK